MREGFTLQGEIGSKFRSAKEVLLHPVDTAKRKIEEKKNENERLKGIYERVKDSPPLYEGLKLGYKSGYRSKYYNTGPDTYLEVENYDDIANEKLFFKELSEEQFLKSVRIGGGGYPKEVMGIVEKRAQEKQKLETIGSKKNPNMQNLGTVLFEKGPKGVEEELRLLRLREKMQGKQEKIN